MMKQLFIWGLTLVCMLNTPSQAAINFYGMKTAGPNVVKCRELCQQNTIKCQQGVNQPGYIDWCSMNCLKNSQGDQIILDKALKACQFINQHNYSAIVNDIHKDQIIAFDLMDSKTEEHHPEEKICIHFEELSKELNQFTIKNLKKGDRVVFDTIVEHNAPELKYRLCPTRHVITGKIAVIK